MIYFRRTFDFGWGMGIVGWYRKNKLVRGVFPISTVGSNMDVEGTKIIRIGEYNFGHLTPIQFRNICINTMYVYIYVLVDTPRNEIEWNDVKLDKDGNNERQRRNTKYNMCNLGPILIFITIV
jgi:hypothetical protein